MIELEHNQPEPPALRRFRARTPNAPWSELPHNVKNDIHDILDVEQENLCVYCETEINRESCHLEHIQPQSVYPNLRFRYSNLAQSCNSPDHCGHKKGKQEIPISPQLDCNIMFSLSGIDGELNPVIDFDQEQRDDVFETIRILKLNSPDIAWKRQQFFTIVMSLGDEAASFLTDQPFRHVLQTIL
jgi:uncharacterized protein (TIGR02646 family)